MKLQKKGDTGCFASGTSGNLCTKIFSTNFRRDDKKKRKKGIVVWEREILELKGKQIEYGDNRFFLCV